MRHAEVDAKSELPFGGCFEALEREIPAAGGEEFGHAAAAAVLARDGNALLGGVERQPVLREHVDAGQLHGAVVRHGGANGKRLVEELVLGEHVAGAEKAVARTPAANFAGEGVGEKLGPATGVVVAETRERGAANVKKDFGQMVDGIVAETAPEPGGKTCRPAFREEGGLVEEDSRDGFAEFFAHFARVRVVNKADEVPDRLAGERVEIAASVVPGTGNGGFAVDAKKERLAPA